MRNLTLHNILSISFVVILLFSTTAFAVEGARIESEYKLDVPDEIELEVWDYLIDTYIDSPIYLSDPENTFTASNATEFFEDLYYDTPDLNLLEMQSAVRYRQRFLEGNLKKPDKELMQIKISTELMEVAREEIKFTVKHYKSKEEVYDKHLVVGLVKRKERSEFIDTLKELSINPAALKEILKIKQTRRRVYILRNNAEFATITLDTVRPQTDSKAGKFVELEMELNEVAYTEADAEERVIMEELNEQMRAHLFDRFPMIVQDQTPKYNKSFNVLKLDPNTYSKRINHVGIYILILALFLISFFGYQRIVELKSR